MILHLYRFELIIDGNPIFTVEKTAHNPESAYRKVIAQEFRDAPFIRPQADWVITDLGEFHL